MLHLHILVHSFPIWTNLLILQSRLNQIQGKYTSNTNNAGNTAIKNLW